MDTSHVSRYCGFVKDVGAKDELLIAFEATDGQTNTEAHGAWTGITRALHTQSHHLNKYPLAGSPKIWQSHSKGRLGRWRDLDGFHVFRPIDRFYNMSFGTR